jgi:UDP-N-acetylglucosamine--N-acetylmuramyl-(pentapeptide) pyrophosphoryl-undecaprenol N-acetylglucosamine transferase
MKIVAAGGGSGGHVTPILAVLGELKRLDPELKSYIITDHTFGPQASDIVKNSPLEIKLKRIYAGKLRRYHKVSLVRQLFDVPMFLKNVRDMFLVGVGWLQSILFLAKTKPDVVFTKGGFVCLPVGLAARLLRIPLVIHDSDAHPGLTNRLLAGSAKVIATGAPVENYPYPEGRTHYVGIPVGREFRPLTAKQQQICKAELGLHDTKKPLLVVTGGGLGSRNINHAVVTIAPQLLDKIAILHITGQANYQEVSEKAPEHIDYMIKPFLPEGLATAFGAADVVITRAGATTMIELASMGKPTIIVPHPHLTGGHQLKNAEVYEKANAAVVLQEEDIILDQRVLLKALADLFAHIDKRRALARNLHRFSKPEAALDLAALIVEAAATKKIK